MKFLATLIVLVAVVAAIPALTAEGELLIEKRTCGTLSATALEICQNACKGACTLISAGLASSLCEKACEVPPL
ncbi:hypothetical protein DL95DRAFT_455591 [Leptodontidium sp. 2 PMI_412]|nr:hypothetical protein DL95DRAFT_455591 [Leptodontidium sp. 2 PMI_412]